MGKLHPTASFPDRHVSGIPEYGIIVDMSEIEKYKGEYTVLSYLVTCAERAREIMRRATVNESMFSSDENRAAFIALMAEPATDDTLLLGVAAKALPAR